MRQPNPEDPTTYPQYDVRVHDLPLKAKASAGDAIDSNYVGSATIVDVYPCAFYGAPPVYRGDPVSGGWDGMAYVVDSEWSGRTTLDRSRLGRVTPGATAGLREPAASSSLLSVEGDCEVRSSSEVSLAAVSQAEDASPVMCTHCRGAHAHGICTMCPGREGGCSLYGITPAQHVGALSMPFDGARPTRPTAVGSDGQLPPASLARVIDRAPAYYHDVARRYASTSHRHDALERAFEDVDVPAELRDRAGYGFAVTRAERMAVRWIARNVVFV